MIYIYIYIANCLNAPAGSSGYQDPKKSAHSLAGDGYGPIPIRQHHGAFMVSQSS